MIGEDQGVPRRWAATIEGDVVILDIDADRYFLGVAGESSRRGQGAAAKAAHSPGTKAWSMPTRTLGPSGRTRAILAVNAVNCLLTVAHVLKHRTFAELVDRVDTAKAARSPGAWPAQELVASFAAIRPFVRQARICRLDAPALCILFRRYGHDARLVFGVRLRPFAAHCWAQLDDAAIIEAPEDLRQYTPILAI